MGAQEIAGAKCSRCGKDAKLECPKCLQAGMPKVVSAFCSQDCFKAGWAEHKDIHKATERSYMVAPTRAVPDSIEKPDWAATGYPSEEVVHDFTVEHGAYPSPLRYHHFPKSVCTSVNEVVCHGIPDMRELQDGDIVNVDVSCMLNGAHGDLNETFTVGNVDEESKRLVKVTYECLMKAVKAVRPGLRYRDVGNIISTHATNSGFSVVKTYCGHGIGSLFHCAPSIPHYAHNKAKGVMHVGHTFTIEPMINAGHHANVTWPDGWTAVTSDGKRSAQFEHGLVVTEDGCRVLTARTAESPPLWWESEGVPLSV